LNHAFYIGGGGDIEDRVYLKQCKFTAIFERQYLNKTASISKQELFCVEKYFQKV
jgi:hypothetical protein